MYWTLFLDLCKHLLFHLFDPLLTLILLASDHFLNELRILLLFSHLSIMNNLLLLLKLFFQYLGSRSVSSCLEILLRLLRLLLLLIGLYLIVEVGVQVGLLDLGEVTHELLLL
jgi:hypothetical protein